MKTSIVIFLLAFPSIYMICPVYGQTDSFSSQISKQLSNKRALSQLYFPKSVKRYYLENGHQLVWLGKLTQEKHTFEAMMILDCVLQYGLAHADYHPDVLIYDALDKMLNTPGKVSMEQRVRFDILLTDAMIARVIHNI